MGQLLITFVFALLGTMHEPTQQFIEENPALKWIAIIIIFSTIISLMCCQSLSRQIPINYILLIIFTLAESYMIAVYTSFFYPELVCIALGLTALVSFSLSLFALQTKIDFTVFGGFLFVVLIVFTVVVIVAMFFPGKLIQLIISSIGVILFSLYLIYDTQLMVGGDHKYSISPGDYILATLALYLDIINIFIYILGIIAATND